MISYRLWQRRFAGDRGIIGKPIRLDGRPYTILGVAPAGFQGLDMMAAQDIWVPMAAYREVYANPLAVSQRRALMFKVVGRLKPGVDLRQAQAGMDLLARDLERAYPAENQGRRVQLVSLTRAALPANEWSMVSRVSVVLLVISGLVLLIACGNVASLLLARAAVRSKEIAVRMAMGATRLRLVRQLLTESIVLGLAGGGCGLLVARWSRDLLWALRPPMFTIAAVELAIDRRVLFYSLAISLGTGILFGLLPALRATAGNLAVELKERTGRGSAAAGGGHPRRALVMVQVALSVIALVGAGLFLRSMRSAETMNPGFDADHVGVVVFNLPRGAYSAESGREFERRAIERAATVPGVAAASMALDWPFQVTYARTIILEGQEDAVSGKGRRTLLSVMWPGFLRAVGTSLVHGRDLSEADNAGSRRVAVVNEVAASAFWPGEDAVGRRIRFSGDDAPVEIIGVARNANYLEIGERPQPMVYLSMLQQYFPQGTLYIRSKGDPAPVLAAVRREVQALAPALVLQTESTRELMSEALWAQRLSARLLGVFGLLALTLATLGIYGVLSYSVNQRRRELGVRMALGATAADVHRLVLRDGVRLVALGAWAGLMLALAGSRLVDSLLYSSGGRDALPFLAVPVILGVVAVVACWVPAHRATRIDPASALREE